MNIEIGNPLLAVPFLIAQRPVYQVREFARDGEDRHGAAHWRRAIAAGHGRVRRSQMAKCSSSGKVPRLGNPLGQDRMQ